MMKKLRLAPPLEVGQGGEDSFGNGDDVSVRVGRGDKLDLVRTGQGRFCVGRLLSYFRSRRYTLLLAEKAVW